MAVARSVVIMTAAIVTVDPLIEALLAALDFSKPKHRVECPACGRGSKDRTMGVTLDADGGAVWHCFRCELAGARGADSRITQRIGKPVVPHIVPQQSDTLTPRWSAYWNRLGPLRGDAVAYLRARGCCIPPTDGDLRFDPRARHPSGYTGPAIVALVTDAVDARLARTLHRTWVNADGTKTNVEPPRLLLEGHRKAGGVIRLWADDVVTTGLGVAEGIESALTAARVFKPMWCGLDAGNLTGFPVLPGIEAITLFADHDDAGLDAAGACAQRWADAGREVCVACPPERGADINDHFLQEAHRV
jgi:putative DNA primase/helicase